MKKINLKTLKLKSGSHKSAEDGLCIMEAVAYFAGEQHSDKPKCACPVLTSYMIRINDSMNDEERKILKPYIKKIIGTKDGNSQKRMEILVHHALVKVTPYALELAGLQEHANKMKKLKFKDWDAAEAAGAAAWSAARAVEAAAGAAARDAAWSAARAAAWAAARDAARDAAWSAAWSAAGAAEAAEAKKERKIYWKMALKALDEALEVK